MNLLAKAQVQEMLTRRINVVPLVKELPADMLTPVTAFLRLTSDGAPCFLLESVAGGQHIGRYTFLGTAPWAELRVIDGRAVFSRREGPTEVLAGNPFHAMGRVLRRYRAADVAALPRFSGGAVGVMGYEMIRHLEPTIAFPDATDASTHLMMFANVVVFDRLRHSMLLIANIIHDATGSFDHAYAAAMTSLEEMEMRLRRVVPQETALLLPAEPISSSLPEPRATWSRDDFLYGVKRLKSHIRRGDIFQAVLSMGFRLPISVSPFHIYRCLRRLNPSPYTFYLDSGDQITLGASPEMLVRVEGRRVETRPIAGTRRRGATESEDRLLERRLVSSPKERAEHVMLVDLGRNDVGRIAQPGTVEVPSLMRIERYSHVMHMVSSVTGRLRRGASPWDALASCFPAGTVTGAPKIKATQLIAEIEPHLRGAYAGCVVYHDFRGNLDSAIAIRSLSVFGTKGQREACVQAGAGIVADSSPSREYAEVEAKAGAVMEAISRAERGLP